MTRSRASSTYSITASSNCFFALGRTPGRLPSTIVPRLIASSPISDPRSGSARARSGNLDSVPDAAKLGYAGLLGAQANPPRALPVRSVGCSTSRRRLRSLIGTRLVDRIPRMEHFGQALQCTRRGCAARAQHLQRTRQDQGSNFHQELGPVSAISADRRPVRASRRFHFLLQWRTA